MTAPAESTGPPPLAWQEVLQEFHQQATPWYLDRPRYRLSGRTWGTGSPLYFFNGMGGTLDLFALTVRRLRDQFRCVLFDYPGTLPGSTADMRNLSLAQLAEDVFAIADRCGDETFDLFATSFGGLVAWESLLSEPQRIRRVVLQGTFAHRPLSVFERLLLRVGHRVPGTVQQVPFAGVLSKFVLGEDLRTDDAFQTLACRATLLRDADYRESLTGIEHPILVLYGDQDRLVSERLCREMVDGLKHARLEILSGAGHLPFLTHPLSLAKRIEAFLT